MTLFTSGVGYLERSGTVDGSATLNLAFCDQVWDLTPLKGLPLTALNNSLRAVINEGAALSTQGFAIAIMLAWGVVSFVVALRLFRWQ